MIQPNKILKGALDLKLELDKHRKYGKLKGAYCGFDCADEFISLKKGYPLMIGGLGGSGKTEFTFELIIRSIINHGWRWLILSPETGNALEIYTYLISKLTNGKDFFNTQYQVEEEHYQKIVKWLHQHVKVLDVEEGWEDVMKGIDLNLKNYFSFIEKAELSMGRKFDGLLIDPFNELDIDLDQAIMRTVKDELKILLRYTKKNNYFTILTNHVNNVKEFHKKAPDGQMFRYSPPAKKEEWAYGMQFSRKGFQMILPYEPHPCIVDELAEAGDREMQFAATVAEYQVREFYVQKSKPNGVGKVGRFRLFWDWKKKRYYEIDDLLNPKAIINPKL